MYRVAIDTGGTFTDYIAIDQDGRTVIVKNPTDRLNPTSGIMAGLQQLAQNFRLGLSEFLGSTEQIVHGTTLALNALLEKQGAHTALLTTEGFRDALVADGNGGTVLGGEFNTVSVGESPVTGGTVTGGGGVWVYGDGNQVTVTATPNAGYNFVNWTENGSMVGSDATYAFTMGTTDRNLVANFAPVSNSGAAATPSFGCNVSWNTATQTITVSR